MRKKVNIGFDIGITSVGWAIVDEENNIIDRGVRLFEELKNPKDGKLENQTRREKRSLRRVISRRRNRKDDFIKLVTRKYFNIFKIKELPDFTETKQNFLNTIIGENTNLSILDTIINGLEKEIQPILLLRVLYYYLSHRGYSYMTIEQYERKNSNIDTIAKNSQLKEFADWYEKLEDKKSNESEINQKIQSLNIKNLGFRDNRVFIGNIKIYNEEKEDLGKYPTQIQKKEFEKHGYFRGDSKNSGFAKQDWIKEIEKLLENQKYLTQDFKNDYMDLFCRLRDFSDGPGSEKSPTKYGLWRIEENGQIKKVGENLWDLTIGKCSVYVDENRANKKSCSSEISNLLNQLNTIEIWDSRRETKNLTQEEKQKIIFDVISKSSNPLNIIWKVCDLKSTNEISKYPTKESKSNKSSDNENIEKLQNTKNLFQILSSIYKITDYDSLIKHKKLFNDIIDVFAKYPKQYEKIESELKQNPDIALDSEIAKEITKKGEKISSQATSSMSLKALDQYIREEIRTNGKTLNQKYKSIIDKNEIDKFKFDSSSKYINENCLDDQEFILSPTTKCSFRETLKVFNKILKRYVYNPSNTNKQLYHIKNVVLEMPIEWNSVDKRKRITDLKNYNEQIKKQAKDQYNYEGEDKTIIRKLALLYSQNNVDVYTGQFIDPQQVILNPNYSEIDHIIPYSISYDDSINNKVLVLRTSNQEKGRRTPKEYLGQKFYPMMKKWEEIFLHDEARINKKKFENLINDGASDDIRRLAGFVGRNLADTRYACRIVKEAMNAWLSETTIKNNLSDEEINVIDITGKYSQRYRSPEYLNIPKDRDEDYSHHAIDATICAILGNENETIGKLIWYTKTDSETGEINFKSFFKKPEKNLGEKIHKTDENIKWKDIADQVKNTDNIKFSYKIGKKTNFGFWGDKIVSIREEKDEKGNVSYKERSKMNLLDELVIDNREKKPVFEVLNDEYENGNKYPDPKMWKDLWNAYKEGLKIKEENSEYSNKNPFELYMQKYCEIYNKGDYKKFNAVFLRRKNKDGTDYEYSVKSIKKYNQINSFEKVKKVIKNSEKFAAYTGLDWKEIRLFKDNKGKFKVLPMRINLYINHLKNKIDENEYNKLLADLNISNRNYYLIHKGSLIVNKNNSSDIRRIAGGAFIQHKLDIQEIYKKSKQNQVSINKILDNYDFCNVDELGNVDIDWKYLEFLKK